MKQIISILFTQILVLSVFAQFDINSGLVAFWKLDDNLNDSYGSRNWTNYNSVNENLGIINQCRGFNYATIGQYCEASSASLSSAASLSFWLYSTGAQANDAGVFFKCHGGSLGDQTVFGAQMAGVNTINFTSVANASNSINVHQPVTFSHNQWHHFVYIFDGVNQRVILFVNGVKSIKTCSFTSLYNPVTKLKMGMQKGSSRSYRGRLDEIGLWNRVLTDDEALYLYNNSIGNSFCSIAIGGIPGNNFTAGQGFPLSISTSFQLNVGNVFTAQLSDINGVFSNPVNIGTYTGISSCSFPVTIPFTMPTGSNYRIRIVSSTPQIISCDNNSNLTIQNNNTIPTLSQWGLMILGGILLGFGTFHILKMRR